MTVIEHDCVLPVDKPEGPTSHDVVRIARRELATRRVGHTGTLDPFASGLLLLCVGPSTRLAEYLSGLDKTYEAVARLGQSTDTLDREGLITEERRGWEALGVDDIERELTRFRGEIEQVPPVYSAKKVDGQRAHRRARSGQKVRLSPSVVSVRELELTSLELPDVGLRISCSSGTYVRALARDVGDALGVGAHLVELRRTAVGSFGVDGALAVEELAERARVAQAALTPLEALRHLPRLDVGEDEAGRLAQGQAVPLPDRELLGPVVVSHAGGLLAIGESTGDMLRPKKVFVA